IRKIEKMLHISHTSIVNNLLLLPGIIRIEEEDRDDTVILSVFKEALDKLVASKKKQGEAIKKEIIKNLKKIFSNIERIKKVKFPHSEEENGNKDIAEEIALISFYINKLEKTIFSNSQGVKGKEIDFLTQEILRELNSASSKIKMTKVAWWLVRAKSYLERIREQAQNIE
ncbi:MAG: DUF1732 domain-containing protein, partial [Candidatus Omnitrophica bacterium]|nr:DUF1732 domain-containing protein [Candidatus Omnitrophota bacterium]